MERVVLVGCGRLGSAFLKGWRQAGRWELFVLDPAAGEIEGVVRLSSFAELASLGRVVAVLAVKPQIVGDLLPELGRQAADGSLFLSLAAGVTMRGLRSGLGERARVARAMPNTAAAVLKAVSVAVACEDLQPRERGLCHDLLAAVGEVIWLEDEALLDAATAVSGSGPAYFFRFTEVLAAAGAALGLPRDVAERLARSTLAGAGALAGQERMPVSALKQAVVSPGGTTAAALAVFDDEARLERLVDEAARAAARRARELGLA